MTETATDLGLDWHDWLAIEREACRRSLATFVREAWHVLEPAQVYSHGWHIDAVCQHLEAVTYGDLTRLLINVPPGTMKSMLVNVFWPAWEWGPLERPAMRFIGASHSEALATRDNLKMRRLVQSEWYQERWPTKLTGDQNAKTYFENEQTGFRLSCPVSSMTGRRGDRVAWDDPHSVEAAISDAHRETALRVFTETLPTRLNNPDRSAIIVVMQRLHEEDVAGYILAHDLGYEHLMLPMEFEPERRCYTSIGFEDPRTEDGELLFPARFPPEVVERDKKVMGSYATAGQFQQRPAPRSGGLFAWEKLEIVAAPPKLLRVIRYWDKAGTAGGGAYTAGVKLGLGDDGCWYILDVVRGQWAAPKREQVIKATAELDGRGVDIWIEQEPGSGGKESAESTVRNLAGYNIRAERPSGDKALRAEPYSVQVEAGNIRVVRAPWNQEFIDEHKTFPKGKYKDQIDATSGGFNKLAGRAVAPVISPSGMGSKSTWSV
jgi:predicted phage terminase large subunit-like protein